MAYELYQITYRAVNHRNYRHWSSIAMMLVVRLDKITVTLVSFLSVLEAGLRHPRSIRFCILIARPPERAGRIKILLTYLSPPDSLFSSFPQYRYTIWPTPSCNPRRQDNRSTKPVRALFRVHPTEGIRIPRELSSLSFSFPLPLSPSTTPSSESSPYTNDRKKKKRMPIVFTTRVFHIRDSEIAHVFTSAKPRQHHWQIITMIPRSILSRLLDYERHLFYGHTKSIRHGYRMILNYSMDFISDRNLSRKSRSLLRFQFWLHNELFVIVAKY